MNKAFVKETGDDEPLSALPEMPTGVKNYITPAGYRHLQAELVHLTESLRAAMAVNDAVAVQTLEPTERYVREIEQRIHYLQTRLDTAEIVDPTVHTDEAQIFFGATVTYQHESGEQQTVTIVGLDELDPAHGKISWLSPVAQSLLNTFEGDNVMLESPAGDEKLQILVVRYPSDVEPDNDSRSLISKDAG